MLIFILQTIWLYIRELAGKDLDLVIVIKFLVYFSPKLIPLVIPLTILLSSIMVFGDFSENYEFAAMKSTGISLYRAMAGLGVFITLLGITTFLFSNNVIPWAEYKSINLRKNIAKTKPAKFIAPGQFSEITKGFNIKVKNKSGKNGEFIEGVVIHQKSGKRKSNHKVTVAKTGKVIGSKKSDILKLILYDGYYYDDTPPKKHKDRKKRPFVKTHFKEYTNNIDLGNLNNINFEEESITNRHTMLNMYGLNKNIDSLKNTRQTEYANLSNTLYERTNIKTVTANYTKSNDTTFEGNILDLFKLKKKIQLVDLSINAVKSSKQILSSKKNTFKLSNKKINLHIIAFHEKIALGFACIILFFVGAPLGALIRKGGLGLPMVIAILLFLTYHFIGIFAKNSAENGSINPIFASWFSTIVMLPLSFFLTKRATADRGLFEFDHITEPLKKALNIKPKGELLKKQFVVDLVSNFENSKKTYQSYKDYALFSFIFYNIFIASVILFFVFKNNKLEAYTGALIQIGTIALGLFTLYLILSKRLLKSLYVQLKEKNRLKKPLALILSILLYPISFFITKSRLNNYIFSPNKHIDLQESTATTIVKVNQIIVKNTYPAYTDYSRFAFIFYCIPLGLIIAYFILKNNKLQAIANAGLTLSAISFILYILYFILSKKQLQKLNISSNFISNITAFIIYPKFYFSTKKKINDNYKNYLS